MDKFENRRHRLMALLQKQHPGRGGIARMSENTNITPSYLSRLLYEPGKQGRKNLAEEVMERLERAYDLPRGWFDEPADQNSETVKVVKTGSKQQAYHAELEPVASFSEWDDTTPLENDEIAVPFFKKIRFSAGARAEIEIPQNGPRLRFGKYTLRSAGVNPVNAIAAVVHGNSMERLIMNGSTIGIDTGSTEVIDGEIYAFMQSNMLRVKYLYNLPGGGIRMRSENVVEHPEELLMPQEMAQENFHIIGWVFWWSTLRFKRSGVV